MKKRTSPADSQIAEHTGTTVYPSKLHLTVRTSVLYILAAKDLRVNIKIRLSPTRAIYEVHFFVS